jgi:hypothetical protein
MELSKLYSKNISRRYTHSIQERITDKRCKLFHSNSVVCNKTTVTFENILSKENRLRTQNMLKKCEQPVITKLLLNEHSKKAAVLVPLCTVNGEPSLLFMLRSNLIPAHRGEVW